MSAIHVELLTKARKSVADGYSPMICIALVNVAKTQEERAAADEIKRHIARLLYPKVGLRGWLIEQGYPAANDSIPEVKATRLAWIDWLIEEWRDAP